jgi:hypothetical protein
VYSDSTKLNPSGSRTEDPISVYILNACDKEKTPILIGYNPCSVNKIKLNGLLKQRKITDKSMASTIRYNTKLENKRQYLWTVMEPLMKYQKTGVLYQVGRGTDSKIYRFFPFVVSLNADQPEQDLRGGSTHKKGHMQCCTCTRENCMSFYRKPLPGLDNNIVPFGCRVKFSRNRYTSTGYVCPFAVNKIEFKQIDEDFDWVDPEIKELDNDMVFQNPNDDQWYLISDHKTFKEDILRAKCYIKMSLHDTVEYIITKLEWKAGIVDDTINNRSNQRAVYLIDDVVIREFISPPKVGFANIRSSGMWQEAVVVGVNLSGAFKVFYTADGEVELNVRSEYFIPTGGVLRDDDKFEMVSKGLAAAEQKQIDHCVSHGKRLRVGKSVGKSLEANNMNLAHLLNVKGGENPLKRWFDFGLPFLTFYGALSVDYMHAFKEGMLTNILSFVIGIVRVHAEYDPNMFATNLLKVNERLINFPNFGAFSPCRMVRFCNGLDDVIEKNDDNPLECDNPNIILGNFEAWKRPALLVQLLFIVESADVISDDEDWIERVYNNKHKQKVLEIVPVFNAKKINLRRLCVQALVAALEVQLFYQSPSLTAVDLKTFEQVLRNCRLVAIFNLFTISYAIS